MTGFNIKCKLVDILAITVLATLSGMKTWNEIELYGKLRLDFLKRFLELPAGIPSHDTINRVFNMLDPEQLDNALQAWVHGLFSTCPPVSWPSMERPSGAARRQTRTSTPTS